MTQTQEALVEVMADAIGEFMGAKDRLDAYHFDAANHLMRALEAAGVRLVDAGEVEENARLREALQAIADRHIPDQPPAYDVSEADYARKHYMELRMLARAALKETGQ